MRKMQGVSTGRANRHNARVRGLNLLFAFELGKGGEHRKQGGTEVLFISGTHDFEEDAEYLQQRCFERGGGGEGRGCLYQKRSIGSLVYEVNFSGKSFACQAAVEEVLKR